jgi:alcohol dehydrogenase class IV
MAVSFVYNNPRVERILFGRGVIDQLADEIRRLKRSRVLVVTSPSIARSPLLERVRESLGRLCVGVYDAVKPHSPTDLIDEAAKLAADVSADALVSVGGGSSIDTAKGIAALLAEGAPLSRLATHFIPPDRKEVPDMPAAKMPHLAIPTTFSGGEYSYSAGVTEGGIKLILADPKLSPRVVLLDPGAAQTAPPTLLAASGMNALAHCVEAIYSTQTQILSQAYCMAAVAPIARFLPRLVANTQDLEAIGEMQIAACLASMGVYSAWTGIHHGIVHAVGGRFHVPHANLHALVLPYAMRWNLDATISAQAKIARAMGIEELDDEKASAEAPEAVYGMNVKMRLPLHLRDLDVPHDSLPSLAEAAFDDMSTHNNPKKIHSPSQILEVLEMAW